MKRKGFTLVELLVVTTMLGIVGYFFIEVFGKSPANNISLGCRNNLKEIGQKISKYRSGRKGKMPQSLLAVMSRKDLSHFRCRYNSQQNLSTYAYEFRDKPKPDDVIAWDAKPEVWHNHFTGRAYSPVRNVLRADGTVKRISEDEFQKLNLRGEVIKIK